MSNTIAPFWYNDALVNGDINVNDNESLSSTRKPSTTCVISRSMNGMKYKHNIMFHK